MKTIKRISIFCSVVVLMFSMSLSVFGANTTADANTKLQTYVANGGRSTQTSTGIAANDYSLSGGGTVTYTDVVTDDGLVNSTFTQLTSDSKQALLSDMMTSADAAVNNEDGVTDETKTTWLNQLQSCNGVGSQLMATLLQNTKPDYVSANRIYAPFSGLVGTCMALGAILVMAFIGLVMISDLAYIALPPYRLMLDGDSDGGQNGSVKGFAKIISYEAKSAVQLAEGGNGGDGQSSSTSKVAVGIYFKKRVVMLIALGICLAYLISGQIFTLVAWILDLLNGFLGF